MNNYIFTYQHSCKKGAEAYILKHAAFKSNIVKKTNGQSYLPFLGEGYYYWEENVKAAHSWGRRRYNNNYNIIEYQDAVIETEYLLDFLNRRNLKYFNELIATYKERREETKNWQIVNWIEFFKYLERKAPGIFPFKYFRADENFPDLILNNEMKNKANFNQTGFYTFLDPMIMLCTINKCDLNCQKKHVLY